ncbi:MAG TPA: hypothetical protein VJ981_00650 [Gammaproteobacteria bacterium]|nr:hypothetical protein [Gammaproteobacteria bacterium]
MKVLHINTILFLLAFTVLLLPVTVAADETDSPSGDHGSTVITPANMSHEDGNLLNEYAAGYNECLTNTSIQQMQNENDPRRVVDHAMKACAFKLEELDQKMTARNFDPNFRMGYIHSVSKRGANNVLRAVMIGMAARQDQENE